MENKLSHLTKEEINTLMEEYYRGENINDILMKYRIKCNPSILYKYFPPMTQEGYICEYCGNNLVIKRFSKTKQNTNRYEDELYCCECLHQPFNSKCKCNECKINNHQLEVERELKQKENEKTQIIMIEEKYSIKKLNPLDYDELTFTHKVFLGSILRVLLSEDLSTVNPINTADRKISPTEKFLIYMIDELYLNKILTVDPCSDLNSFALEDKEFPNVFYIFKVNYYLNLLVQEDKINFIKKILNPDIYSSENSEEAFNLWKKIAIEECIEYMIYQIRSVSFEFEAGDKTYAVFDELLNHFSISQIYGIIWKAVAGASKLYLEKKMPKKQAANSVIGACQRYAERASLKNWKLTEYNRIKEIPQSTISEFYFNTVIKIGDLGFKISPTIP